MRETGMGQRGQGNWTQMLCMPGWPARVGSLQRSGPPMDIVGNQVYFWYINSNPVQWQMLPETEMQQGRDINGTDGTGLSIARWG